MTDQQLKALFPKLLPEKVHINPKRKDESQLWWKPGFMEIVQDNQLLSLCREVEETFTYEEKEKYYSALYKQDGFYPIADSYGELDCGNLFNYINASWQQRIQAVAKVRGMV